MPLRTLLDAATATGAGTEQHLKSIPSDFTIQTLHTGSPTTVVLDIEGSIDDKNYVQIAQHTLAAATDMFHISGKPMEWIKANITTLTGGTAPTVTVQIRANENE